MSNTLNSKVYLGDAVYAEVERGMLKLTVEYGFGPEETIYLEPQVLVNLLDYLKEVREEYPKEEK